MQENNKIEDEYILMPCPCPCHRNTGMKHVMACCENGFIKVRKQQQPAPSSTPQSVEGIKQLFDKNGFDFDAFEYENEFSAKAIIATINQLVGDKDREIDGLKEMVEDLQHTDNENKKQLLQAQKEVDKLKLELEGMYANNKEGWTKVEYYEKQLEYYKARCEAAEKL